MTTFKLLSIGLVTSAILAGSATARERHSSQSSANDAYASTRTTPVTSKRGCVRAPDEGSYASAPYRKPPCEPTGRY
jgi:uncharacterized protein YceK